MKLKTILLTTVATGAFMCEPVIVHAVNSTPDSMDGSGRKRKVNLTTVLNQKTSTRN